MPPKNKRRKKSAAAAMPCTCAGTAAMIPGDAFGGTALFLAREVRDGGGGGPCTILVTDGSDRNHCWKMADSSCTATEEQPEEYARKQRLATLLSGRPIRLDTIRVLEADAAEGKARGIITLILGKGKAKKAKKAKGKESETSNESMVFHPEGGTAAAEVCSTMLTAVASELAELQRSIAGLKAKKEVEAGKHQLAVVSATTRDAHNPLPQGDNRKLLLFKAILESKDERIRVLEEKRQEGRRIVAASPTKVTMEENVFDGRQRIQGGAGRSSNPHGENSGGGGGGGAAAAAAVGSNKKIAGRSNGGGGGGGGAKAAATARDGSADDSDESDMEL